MGWATAYAARTLTEAQLEEIDSRYRIDDTRFSPAYVYNQIKIGGCDGGSLIRDAMQILERQGVAQLDDYLYDDGTCSRSLTSTAPRRSVLQAVADGEAVLPVRDDTITMEGIAQDESAIKRVTVSPAASVRYSSQGGFRAVVRAPATGSQSVTVTAADVHGNTSTATYRLRRVR